MEIGATPMESLHDGFLGFVRAYTSTAGSSLEEAADCTVFTTPIRFPVFNGVLAPRFEKNASARIDAIQDRLKEHATPFSWMVIPCGATSTIEGLLRAKNPAFEVPLNGMEAAIHEIAPEPGLPAGVEITYAQDANAVTDYCNLYTRLYGAPTEGWVDAVIA